ncbi:MAG: PEP-utilizing enzyme [archaeon]
MKGELKPDQIIMKMKEHGVKHATKRELPMLCLSVVFKAYCRLLKREVGFIYDAWGAIGKEGIFYSLVNEDDIARKTALMLERSGKPVEFFLDRAKRIHADAFKKIRSAEAVIDRNPMRALSIIISAYPLGMLSIGVYNVFWRMVGDSNQQALKQKTLERISKERNMVADFYPATERLIQRCAGLIGKRLGIEGELLRYMTLLEMESFLKGKKVTNAQLAELARRRNRYFYMFMDGKEYVTTDDAVIDAVEKNFFKYELPDDGVIKGVCAYAGKIRGKVLLLDRKKQQIIDKNTVLVTHMTLPEDTPVVNRCAALITDEGGMLCHAAITARELKKPCVIGTKIATKVLKDGDTVEVNANHAWVRILKRKKQQEKEQGKK